MSDEASVAVANLTAARALVDALISAGLRHAVVCPGSRSGPLAIALDERGAELRIFVLTDERSAGFFALGLARECGKPALVVCTSGTAAANLVPAAAEAFFAEIPLLLATADRPPEARDFAASQTIHQVGLFAAHARASMDLAPPAADLPPVAYYRAAAARAFAIATGAPSGPVHMNVPFREPLLPVPLPPLVPADSHLRCLQGVSMLGSADVEDIARRLESSVHGLLVCGPSSRADTAPALAELARALGWPVVADALSGLRSEDFADLAIADAHDAMLRSASYRRRSQPDFVLRFGGVPTSKGLQQALAEWCCPQLMFSTPGTWPDPTWSATEIVACDPAATAAALALRLRERALVTGDATWRSLWARASSAVRETLDVALDRLPALAEGRIARDLARRIPEGGLFFVGNSSPIRDVDTFAASTPRGARVLANRGANGIDGVLSTAIGAAAATARPTILLLGDLSFLHDVGALQLARRLGVPLLVVVINNDGGGIFHTLPAARLGETFERCFATPHGLDLSASIVPGAAGACPIQRVATGAELERLLGGWLSAPELGVVEIPSDRREATAARASILDEAVVAVERQGALGA